MVAAIERPGAKTIECERTLAELRRDLDGLGRWARPRERYQVTLAAMRRLRAGKNEAYLVTRPGYTTHDYAAYDARYDVRAMRRYLDLLAARMRADNRAQGLNPVMGASWSPAQAAYALGR